MEFMTRIKRPTVEETKYEEDKVERAGYIPADLQIVRLIQAGERLGKFRKEQFDQSFEEKEDLMIDPTRSGNFDLADASQYSLGLKGKFEKQAKEKKEKESKPDKEKPAENGTT